MRAQEISVLTGTVTVLKGSGTVIAQKSGGIIWINPTGTAGLATRQVQEMCCAEMIWCYVRSKFDFVSAILSSIYLHGASENIDCGLLAGDIAPSALHILQNLRMDVKKNGLKQLGELSLATSVLHLTISTRPKTVNPFRRKFSII